MSLLRTCFLAVLASALFCLDTCEVPVGFEVGEMIGDPSGTSVYLIDATTPKLYAIDTSTGTVRVQAGLQDGSGDPLPAEAVVGAYLALSTDSQHLYISLPSEQCIQRYNTTDLTFEAQTPLAFTPGSFVVTTDGIICVAHEGAVLWEFSTVLATDGSVVSSVQHADIPLLQLGDNGTSVHASGVISNGYEGVATYDIDPDGHFTLRASTSVFGNIGTDFAANDTDGVVYYSQADPQGIGIAKIAEASRSFLSNGYGTDNICIATARDSDRFAAATRYWISLYRRDDHGRMFTFIVGNNVLPPRCLAVAANGHIIYRTNNQRLGIIGLSHLSVLPGAPQAALSVTVPGNLQRQFSSVLSTGGASSITDVRWSIDNSDVSNDAVFTHTFTAAGTHDIMLTITTANGATASTRTIVTVTDATPPTYRLAVIHGTGSGTYAAGTVVTVEAIPPTRNLSFLGWSGTPVSDIASLATTLVVPTHDVTLVARFSGPTFNARSACESDVSFNIGAIRGDPATSTVYLLDASSPRILAIDTTTGTINRQVLPVNNSGTRYLASSFESSSLALSPDGDKLFVSLPSLQRIQRYNAANLTLETEIPLRVYPTDFQVSANGHIIAAYDLWPGHKAGVFDANTGTETAALPDVHTPLLTIGGTGNRAYSLETNPSRSIRSWEINDDGSVSDSGTYPQSNTLCNDFAVNEVDHQFYVAGGGNATVTIIDMHTGDTTEAAFGSPGWAQALAQIPGGHLVAGSTENGITMFNRVDFRRHVTHPVNAGTLYHRSLAMTYGEFVLYRANTRRLGIIGLHTLSIDPAAPVACFSATSTGVRRMRFSSASSSGGAATISSVAWSIDGVAASSDATFETTFASPGRHTVELVVTNALGLASMSRQSLVIPAPVAEDEDNVASDTDPNCGVGAGSGLVLAALLSASALGVRRGRARRE
ncbi:MAG: PKD domain-containing protein [Planctomycetes bacterium]|nr:PKD domain-containing protein [Planctomycetota bacterium]